MADNQRIDDLRRRVQKDPASIAFAQLAEECRRAGNLQEAVDVCRSGLALHPGYLSARVTLGRALIELDDLDTALAELEYVLRSAPENLAAIRGLAEIHHRQGHLTLALEQYRAALLLARNDPDLQRTVDELTYQLEPPAPPEPDEGLSFEQAQDEFLQSLSPPSPETAAAPEVGRDPDPEHAAAVVQPEAEATPEAIRDAEPEAALASFAAASVPDPVVPLDAAPASIPPPVLVERVDLDERLEDTAERDHALRMIAALEQWIDAIHVVRAQPLA